MRSKNHKTIQYALGYGRSPALLARKYGWRTVKVAVKMGNPYSTYAERCKPLDESFMKDIPDFVVPVMKMRTDHFKGWKAMMQKPQFIFSMEPRTPPADAKYRKVTVCKDRVQGSLGRAKFYYDGDAKLSETIIVEGEYDAILLHNKLKGK